MPSDYVIPLGAEAQRFLYGARAGVAFTFGGNTTPVAVNQLLQSGCIDRVNPDEPYYVPGLYRFTRRGQAIAETLPHRIDIVPSPKMDTPNLVKAVCICGMYESGPTTEAQAQHRGTAHINDKKVQVHSR